MLGIALFLSVVNVYFRDTQHLIAILLMVLFYLTPIVYPIKYVPDTATVFGITIPLGEIYRLNPLVVIVGAFRDVLYDLRFPPLLDLAYLIAVGRRSAPARHVGVRQARPPPRRGGLTCRPRSPSTTCGSGSASTTSATSRIKAMVVRGRRARYEEFDALKGVSFEIAEGSTFGLIGENGSGKSTLLKCMARILRPDRGTITTEGKISALLELGAGFHPELSGRENVYLNGAILGMSKRADRARFDEIVEFAGLERFIDTPVKNYSSGMYVRLGFAVAINVDPDILLVDEVLAVGDEQFQRKCSEKFAEFKESGKTIVIVSHALGTMRTLCDQVALLEHGSAHRRRTARSGRRRLPRRRPRSTASPTASTACAGARARPRSPTSSCSTPRETSVTTVRTGDAVTFRLHYEIARADRAAGVRARDLHHRRRARHRARTPGRRTSCPTGSRAPGFVDFHVAAAPARARHLRPERVAGRLLVLHAYDFRHRAFRFDVERGHARGAVRRRVARRRVAGSAGGDRPMSTVPDVPCSSFRSTSTSATRSPPISWTLLGVPPDRPIVDVGGAPGFVEAFLPDRDAVVVDVEGKHPGRFVIATARGSRSPIATFGAASRSTRSSTFRASTGRRSSPSCGASRTSSILSAPVRRRVGRARRSRAPRVRRCSASAARSRRSRSTRSTACPSSTRRSATVRGTEGWATATLPSGYLPRWLAGMLLHHELLAMGMPELPTPARVLQRDRLAVDCREPCLPPRRRRRPRARRRAPRRGVDSLRTDARHGTGGGSARGDRRRGAVAPPRREPALRRARGAPRRGRPARHRSRRSRRTDRPTRGGQQHLERSCSRSAKPASEKLGVRSRASCCNAAVRLAREETAMSECGPDRVGRRRQLPTRRRHDRVHRGPARRSTGPPTSSRSSSSTTRRATTASTRIRGRRARRRR